MKLKLKQDVLIKKTNDSKLIFYYITGFKLQIHKNSDLIVKSLKRGCHYDDLVEFLGEKNTKKLVSYLTDYQMLSELESNPYKETILEKQIYYLEQFGGNPVEIQKIINSKRILIIGVGGIGGNTIQNLVASGLKNFILIDNDSVQVNNLNRQYLYTKSSIGNLKVNECKKYIMSINDETDVKCYNLKINDKDMLNKIIGNSKIDLIVNAADQPNNIKDVIFTFCKDNSIPYITAGLHISKGVIGPLITQKDFKIPLDYPLYSSTYTKNSQNNNESVITGSFGPTNSIVASILADNIIKFFIGEKTILHRKIVTIDFNNLKYTSVEI